MLVNDDVELATWESLMQEEEGEEPLFEGCEDSWQNLRGLLRSAGAVAYRELFLPREGRIKL